MEIKVNIPINDYVQPTEVREEIVQAICDAFLCKNIWRVFHPFNDGAYRPKSALSFGKGGSVSFNGHMTDSEVKIYPRTCEIKLAFEILIKAKYFIAKRYYYGTWLGYECYKKKSDAENEGTIVSSFEYNID